MSDPVERARKLLPTIRALADRAEQERRLPGEIASAFSEASLYRLAAPAEMGGGNASPATQIKTIEAVSEADGSAGWNLMIGIETFGLIAPMLPSDHPWIQDTQCVFASSTAAVGRLDEVEGGYRMTGRWPFVSGVHNAQVFGGLSRRYREGEPIDDETPVYGLVPIEETQIHDTWNVAGLRGSGSHDVSVNNVFVPKELVGGGVAGGFSRSAASPLFRIPPASRLAYNKVGVGFGIARAALDGFIELATGKLPRFSSLTLRERPYAQRAIAQAEARLRSARALVLERAHALWSTVVEGDRVSSHDRAILQIACSNAAQAAAGAVDLVADAAGTSSNFISEPLERQQRDVRVIRQHVTVAPHHIEDAGRMLLGLDAEGIMLAPPQPPDDP